MKKQYAKLISFIMIISTIAGCATTTKTFDDEKIIFHVADSQSNNELNFKTVQITNNTGLDLANLSFKIIYPLDRVNNKNKTERETVEIMEEFMMKSGETKELLIPLAINENIDALDMEIDFKGNVVETNKKVHFEIGGALRTLVDKH